MRLYASKKFIATVRTEAQAVDAAKRHLENNSIPSMCHVDRHELIGPNLASSREIYFYLRDENQDDCGFIRYYIR